MRVLANNILLKETIGTIVGCCCQTNQVSVKVVQHLLPHIINRTMTLIDDDEVKELNGHLGVIHNRHWSLGFCELFSRVHFLQRFVQFFAL